MKSRLQIQLTFLCALRKKMEINSFILKNGKIFDMGIFWFAYLGWRGSGEGLDWASGGLPSPRSHHLQTRSRERKTGSECGGAGSVARRCEPAAMQPHHLQSARCGTGGPPAGCLHTNHPHPSSWGPNGPLWWRRGSAPPRSTFSVSPWLD